MAFKIFAFACFVAVAQAGIIAPVAHYAAPAHVHYSAPQVHYVAPQLHYAAPQVHYAAPAKVHYAEEEHHAPAEYNFEYSVHDEHTGDIKSQKETRHGDQVQGSYSLIEADGSRRVVEYTADKHSGFNAVVHNEPNAHAPLPVHKIVKVAAPVYAHAAPIVAHAAPVITHAAPVVAHATPVYAHVAPVVAHAPVYHHAAPVHSYYH